MDKVLVVARISKTLAFSFINTNCVFADACVIFAKEGWDFFSIIQSTIHSHWAWHYCTTMKSDLNYTPSNTFETFPFPQNISEPHKTNLENIGKDYHEFRAQLMCKMQLGLTKTYNLFHQKNLLEVLPVHDDQVKSKSDDKHNDILIFRKLHKQMDEIALQAYGWDDIDLAHDFYEVYYLPENDRVRYTISPEARKEVLKRLLKLNHEIHEQEVKEGLDKKNKQREKAKNKIWSDGPQQTNLFD